MKLQRLVKNAVAIQSIPAPTLSETLRGNELLKRFKSAHLKDVGTDPAGNVYGRVPGGDKPPVIVTAHLDSVFKPEDVCPAEVREGRIVGPGIGDNAVALASLIELAADLPEKMPAGDVWLVANVAEEGLGNLLGIQHVIERFGDRVTAYLVLEGMALGHIYHRGLPIRRFRVVVRGQGGHSWIHAGRPSAVHVLIAIGDELLSLPLAERPRTSLNIGRIQGGTSVNTIADTAAFEVDIRSISAGTLDELVHEVERVVGKPRGEDIEVTLEPIGHRPGGGLPPDHWLVRAARRAFEAEGLGVPHLEAGSTDASLPLSLGLPAVCVGLTYGGDAHSLHEFIEIAPLEPGYLAVLDLISETFVSA